MSRPFVVALLAAFIALVIFVLGTVPVSGQAPEKPRPGFLSALKESQSITLKEVAGTYQISIFENGPAVLGHKVIEIGTDYLTVEDLAGVTETRIPIYSIKSIVRLRLPRKQP